MAKITIRFEPDPALDHIDVLIRAREQDAEVTALMERLSGQTPDTITVFDGLGNFRTLSQESILSAFAERKLVTIVTENGSWYTRRTLQNLEETLDKSRFLRAVAESRKHLLFFCIYGMIGAAFAARMFAPQRTVT